MTLSTSTEDALMSLQARLAGLQRWSLDFALRGKLSSGRAEQMLDATAHCEKLIRRLTD